MVTKKKYLGGLNLLLLLLFVMVLGMSSTCYASISRDYIQFTLDCAYNDTNLSLSSTQANWLNTYKNRNSSVTELLSFLDYYAGTYNMPKNDYNIICFPYKPGSSGFYLYYFFSNCSFAPSNIGFLNLTSYNATTLRPSNLNGSCLVVSLYFTDSNPSVSSATSFSSYYLSNPGGYTYNDENTVLNLTSCYNYMPTQSIYFTPRSRYMLLNNGSFTYTNTLIPPEPEEPSGEVSGDIGSTGTITNPSGEVTGNVDLSGIENTLGNIENKIPTSGEIGNILSGETGKVIATLTDNPDLSNTNITSGDISNALGFDFAEDPYANFWLELTTGLSGALTNNVRSIDIQFRGETYTISLDNFAIQVPQFLKSFLAILSTVFIFWKMVKYWKIIIDNITSGNMDEVLEMNEEERNYRFVLERR